MVGVDAHLFLVPTEGILADVERLQLMVALQVWPSPHTAVDDVGKAFSVGDLKAAI